MQLIKISFYKNRINKNAIFTFSISKKYSSIKIGLSLNGNFKYKKWVRPLTNLNPMPKSSRKKRKKITLKNRIFFCLKKYGSWSQLSKLIMSISFNMSQAATGTSTNESYNKSNSKTSVWAKNFCINSMKVNATKRR